ncbi:MAG TPA: NAD(P)-dependent oxidoreductase [Victivallales bacterium]|mgnify:CR=1 FL=1|nr:NAD(P)-dependent oxidoreductase [Victivallales bacterium]
MLSTILVTGAGGYLGSKFLKFLPRGVKIFAMLHKKKDVPLLSLPNIHYFIGDITDEKSYVQFIRKSKIIVHLAAIKGTQMCNENIGKTIMTNVYGTHLLIENAIRYGVERFVFASTYWVYGDKKPPFREDVSIQPTEVYGMSKALSEKEIMSRLTNYLILRFSNIYGPSRLTGEDDVVFHFIKKAWEGKDIILHNCGKHKLDFIYIDEVCQCLAKFVVSNHTGIFNIGYGKPTSIKKLSQIISEVFKKKYKTQVKVVCCSSTSNEFLDRWLDTKKARQTDFLVTDSLKKNISRYVGYYIAQHKE